jgi:hypothetical protein
MTRSRVVVVSVWILAGLLQRRATRAAVVCNDHGVGRGFVLLGQEAVMVASVRARL